jgi:hypothetical protein
MKKLHAAGRNPRRRDGLDGLRESGAGKTKIYRIPDVVYPYEPDHLFRDGDKLLI